MRAMILAAGRGERMGELTRSTPKPLLKINDRFLIEYSIRQLAAVGITEIVINVCYFATKMKEVLKSGRQYGVNLIYSEESEALETGGGIVNALPLLGDQSFIVLSADVVTNYPLERLLNKKISLAHLVMVDNPYYHQNGDFSFNDQHLIFPQGKTYTFGNIGLYHPDLFLGYQSKKFRLGDLLRSAIQQKKVTGEYYQGFWHNVGTEQDLYLLSGSDGVMECI